MAYTPRLTSLSSRLQTVDVRSAKPEPKTADPFYSSAAYLQWRETVIRRSGGKCQWPGCGRRDGRLFADHIVERKDGGDPLDPNNGQALCGRHHTLKTNTERARRQAR